MNGELEAKPEPSEVEGAPTFNVGAVISVSCRSGYHNPVSAFIIINSYYYSYVLTFHQPLPRLLG